MTAWEAFIRRGDVPVTHWQGIGCRPASIAQRPAITPSLPKDGIGRRRSSSSCCRQSFQGGGSGGGGTGGCGRSSKEGNSLRKHATVTGFFQRSIGLSVVGCAGQEKR
jgi:hypothetical protein